MTLRENLIDQLIPPAPLEEHCGQCGIGDDGHDDHEEGERKARGQKRLAKLYARRPDLLARDKQVHS
jgi:hypothetical protein